MQAPLRHRVTIIAGIAIGVILLDQLSKWLLIPLVTGRPPTVVTDFFSLVMVWNYGVSFGMLNDPASPKPYFLMALALVISLVLTQLALKTALRQERIGYALVIGGALGNVIDRIRFGAVADFFYFHLGTLGWPAFNIADAAICIGVGILLIAMLRNPKVGA